MHASRERLPRLSAGPIVVELAKACTYPNVSLERANERRALGRLAGHGDLADFHEGAALCEKSFIRAVHRP